MKKYVLKVAALLAIVILSSCSENKEKCDLENFVLDGKVKSITSISYDVFDKFGEGNLQKVKPENGIIQITSFDSLGNILSDRYISINNIKRKYTSIYNDKHQQTKWLCYKDDDDTQVQYGHNYYYDEKGNLLKEIDLKDENVTNYKNSYDNDGHLISQIGGPYKRYWEYDNGHLIKYTERFFDMEDEFLYKDGLVYKEYRKPDVYWTHTYDEQKRNVESVVYKHDNIIKKMKNVYSGAADLAPIETIEWNEDGAVEHDSKFTYFTVGKDTITIFQYDKDELINIQFYTKDSYGIIIDTYNTESSLLLGFQYNYENGNMVSMRDLKNNTDHLYVDGIATITEGNDDVTETRYKRNLRISSITKDKNGSIIYSYIVDGDDNKKTITIIDKGETKKGEEIIENGRTMKYTDPMTGRTDLFSYNDAGLLSEVKSSDGTVYTYKYETDPYGNWVKEIEYKNGKPSRIIERSIIYYD